MNSLALFASVALAHLLAVMSPGPDFAMVTRQTLAHGRAAGMRTAVGIGCGISVHVAWGMFGLGWVVARYPLLLDVLRIGGALLLIWMGAQALRSKPATTAAEPAPPAPAHRDFAIGLGTNLLNPKVMMFFVALCSAVITAQTPYALRLALGLWIVATTIGWFCLVSHTLGRDVVRQRLRAWAHWIDRGMGAVLLTLGLAMLFASIHS